VRRVAIVVELDERLRREVLRGIEHRERLGDEPLHLGEAASNRSGRSIVEHCIGGEEFVERIEVTPVERIAVTGDEVLDLESVRDLLE